MRLKPRNSSFLTHFAWYFSGALIPLIINFIKTPIFTRHYSAEEFGVLGLVMISFGYLTTLSFSWIRSCLWRFYPKYKKQQRLPSLYSHLLLIYALSAIVVIGLSMIVMPFFDSNSLTYQLLPIAAVHYALHELLGLYFVVIRLKGKAKQYNILMSIQVVLSFILLLLLTFVAEFNISAMLWCYIVIDVLFIILLGFKSLRNNISKTINISLLNWSELSTLINFGGVSLIATFFLILIVSSDRYIIALYEPIKNVGVYSKTYDVAQMSILALTFIFFNTVNPSMNKVLEDNMHHAKQCLYKYIYAFIFLLLPVVSLASIFRNEITQILLGEEFQSGSILMPYIFFSMLLFGVINFYENEYKFSHRLRQMTVYFGLGFIFNLILNFLFIPPLGMLWAAISTLLSYALILLLFLWNDNQKAQLISLGNRRFIWLILVLLILLILDTVLRFKFEFNLFVGITEAIVFFLIIIGLFWKDVKNLEIPMLD